MGTNRINIINLKTSFLDKFDFLLAFNGNSHLSKTTSVRVVYIYADVSCPKPERAQTRPVHTLSGQRTFGEFGEAVGVNAGRVKYMVLS